MILYCYKQYCNIPLTKDLTEKGVIHPVKENNVNFHSINTPICKEFIDLMTKLNISKIQQSKPFDNPALTIAI